MEAKLSCFFCGRGLDLGSSSHIFACKGCGATFLAERDEEGCIVGLKVKGCGAPECCREEEQGSRGTKIPDGI